MPQQPPESDKPEFLKFATLKKYITGTCKMKSSDSAVALLITECDALVACLIAEAARLARDEGRNTILENDITRAFETQVTSQDLTWQEITESLLRKNSQDLDQIYEALTAYLGQKGTS